MRLLILLLLSSCVSLFFASLVYNIGVRKRFGGIQGSFAKYYRESHPIRRLAKELSL